MATSQPISIQPGNGGDGVNSASSAYIRTLSALAEQAPWDFVEELVGLNLEAKLRDPQLHAALLAITRALPADSGWRAHALAVLSEDAADPDTLIREALEAIREAEDDLQAAALLAVAPYATEETRSEVRALLAEIEVDNVFRGDILNWLDC